MVDIQLLGGREAMTVGYNTSFHLQARIFMQRHTSTLLGLTCPPLAWLDQHGLLVHRGEGTELLVGGKMAYLDR